MPRSALIANSELAKCGTQKSECSAIMHPFRRFVRLPSKLLLPFTNTLYGL